MSEALVVGIVRQAIETAVIVCCRCCVAGLLAGVAGQHLPDGHVDSGQRARVHSARGRHLRRLRADVSVDAARGDRLRRGADPPAAGAGAVIDFAPVAALRRCCWCGRACWSWRRRSSAAPTRRRTMRVGLTVLHRAHADAARRRCRRRREPVGARRRRRARSGDRPGAGAGVRVLIAGAEFAGQLARLSDRRCRTARSSIRRAACATRARHRSTATSPLLTFSGDRRAPRAAARAGGVLRGAADRRRRRRRRRSCRSVAQMLGIVFVLGVRLAAPVIVVLLLVELATRPARARRRRR